MQNDYLSNKKKFSIKNLEEKKEKFKIKVSQKNKVDINKLLNRVKVENQIKKKQNLIITGLVCLAISIIGIISVF